VASPGDISMKLKRNLQNNNLKVTYMTSSPADTTNEKPYKKYLLAHLDMIKKWT
jgi:hypothetical protein